MKECEEEVLIRLVKILKYQEYCEWMLKKDDVIRDYLVLYKKGLCWYHEGVIEKSHSVVMELRLNRVVEVDVESHKMLKVNGEDVNGIDHNRVLDLNDDGERWEGDVLNNQPYGWGVLYDSESRMAFDGFRIGKANVCYGRSYYLDVGVVEYEGEWYKGKRWGRGVWYDRKGEVKQYGEWMNDDNEIEKRVVLNEGSQLLHRCIEENQLLHCFIEELIVSDNSCNGREWSALDLSFMPHLRLLEVGDECFENVKEVKLIGLNQLERVVIGEKSFTKFWHGSDFDPYRRFYLKNCERLKELKMSRFSFSDYSVCEIENVPSLEVMEMGVLERDSFNFYQVPLELKSDSERMK